MAVQDDVRRLSQMDSIYLGQGIQVIPSPDVAVEPVNFHVWHKGRLQQANDGSWLFRSVSPDGTIVGFQLGQVKPNWSSSEDPQTGTTVHITMRLLPAEVIPAQPLELLMEVRLAQQLPQELT
jgi:hypothetical protein